MDARSLEIRTFELVAHIGLLFLLVDSAPFLALVFAMRKLWLW
jgi:hypothetical protein